jgi:hypothetical protein
MTVPSNERIQMRGTTEILDDLNPTTRCYPRTLNDAFPDAPESTEWFFADEEEVTALGYAYYILGVAMWVGLAYYFTR